MSITAALSGVATGGGLANMILGIYPPMSMKYSKFTNRVDPQMIPTIGDLIQMRARGLISKKTYELRALENGFPETFSNFYYEAGKSLLAATEYITLFRRGHIDHDELAERWKELRFREDELEPALKVSEFFPSPGDLISFAVREVYSPDVLAKFGQMQDIPERFLQEAEKAGLPREQAANFWAAHWELPSPQQGFEMLHRRVIDESTLNVLLKALDVMPFWRDKLIAISYNTLTRVDVRRMYGMGTLDRDGVYNAYLDFGYSPDNAELMTQFTIAYESQETAGISRANVIDAYKKDLISQEDVREWLTAFGYTGEIIDFWVDVAEYEKAVLEIESDTVELVNQYRLGAITLEQVRSELSARDLPAPFIQSTIATAVKEKSKKMKLPTRTDLEQWLELEIMDEEEYTDYMKNLGYREDDIVLYLTQIELEKEIIKPRYLTEKVYQRWFKREMISEATFRSIMIKKGIQEQDIVNLILETQEPENESEG